MRGQGLHLTHCGFAGLLLATSLVAPLNCLAQPGQSDVFSTSGEYDRFAVGNAHRWYAGHSTEAKQKASHCLSILDEAKAIQETALALDAQARQPGLDGRQATAFRKQANEQFGLRDKKIRAFIECFNQANRQNPPSDQLATGGGQPSSRPSAARKDTGQKQVPGSTPSQASSNSGEPSDGFSTRGGKTPSEEIETESPSGEKSMKRTPKVPGRLDAKVKIPALKEGIDDCLSLSLPNYAGTDWDRVVHESAGANSVGPLQQSFYLSSVAADQVIVFVQARYGSESDRELTPDYLIGWLTNCLMDRKVLARQEPRILYRRYMEAHEPPDNINKKRITERFEQFGYGGRVYPSIPPFWDHDATGSLRSESDIVRRTPRPNMP